MLELLNDTIVYIINTLTHNALSLTLGILVAAIIRVYVDPGKFKNVLLRKANISIPGSVAFGAFTPFCACGTMAVIVAMLTTTLPWGPIMAFLTSSPLMSPDQFIMLSGVIGPGFAVALALASVIIGLGSGYATHFIEKNSSILTGQARLAENSSEEVCACSQSSGCSSQPAQHQEYHCSDTCLSCSGRTAQTAAVSFIKSSRLKELAETIVNTGIKKVLFYFVIFAAVGYLINRFVPSSIITALFSADNVFSVPLSALIGLPLYVSGSSSIPLIRALMDGGASGGAMLAFMVTGPGTSAGVIAGLATIMKKKAIALYTAYILLGGIILGYIYDLILFIASR